MTAQYEHTIVLSETHNQSFKNVVSRFKLAEKYFKFLGKRTKIDGFKERKEMRFKI